MNLLRFMFGFCILPIIGIILFFVSWIIVAYPNFAFWVTAIFACSIIGMLMIKEKE